MELPDEVRDDLQRVKHNWESRHLLRVYIGCLLRAGWRYNSLCPHLGISSERIRQIAIVDDSAEHSLREYRLITGLQLPVPDAPVVVQPPKGPRGKPLSKPRPETIEQLKRLHEIARRYRGSERHRKEAEMFGALLYYAHVSQGASIYAIAKELKVTPAALQGRLVRYGYKTSTGKSSLYRELTGRGPVSKRPPRPRMTHCKRGHELTPDNIYKNGKSDRTCKTCRKARASRSYLNRKQEKQATQ